MTGRPPKSGLDYFPFDIDFFTNMKVRKIKKDCGPASGSILMSLLCNIYRNGYYICLDEDLPFLVAEETGATEGTVIETINKAVKVGFFDAVIFKRFKVLTSRGIQKRYMHVVRSSKLKRDEINSRYNLINTFVETEESSEEIEENSEEGKKDTEENTQRKEKERKEKKSKDISAAVAALRARYTENQLKIVDTFFDILKHTRKSAQLADSVILDCYQKWDKVEVQNVIYGLHKYIHNPQLHSKKENYVLSIIKNADAAEIERYKELSKNGTGVKSTAFPGGTNRAVENDTTTRKLEEAMLRQNARWERDD